MFFFVLLRFLLRFLRCRYFFFVEVRRVVCFCCWTKGIYITNFKPDDVRNEKIFKIVDFFRYSTIGLQFPAENFISYFWRMWKSLLLIK